MRLETGSMGRWYLSGATKTSDDLIIDFSKDAILVNQDSNDPEKRDKLDEMDLALVLTPTEFIQAFEALIELAKGEMK